MLNFSLVLKLLIEIVTVIAKVARGQQEGLQYSREVVK